MDERLVMITGANAGIGRAATAALARAGCRVVMVCRHAGRGEAACAALRRATGSERIDLLQADLSVMASVHALADTFYARYDRLDVLIHNAAVFDLEQQERRLTAEGNETLWATNYLAPFLLTHRLLDALRASPAARVLTVGSKGLLAKPRLRIDFDDLAFERRRFRVVDAYYQSKLALLAFTLALAERLAGTGAVANAIRVPAVQLDADRVPVLSWFPRAVYSLKRRFSLTTEAMAAVYAYLATSPDVADANGAYFDEHRRPVVPPTHARDPAVQERLWRVSEALVGSSEGG